MQRKMKRIRTMFISDFEALFKKENSESSCKNSFECHARSIKIDGYDVYTKSMRYKTFMEKGYKCACCGREGTHYILEIPLDQNSTRAHFNLYSDDNVLMTKDHILPKSAGGKNYIENMQTMCEICNLAKGGNFSVLGENLW